MLNFIKRNAKFVVTIGVSVLVIAGLSTALILTNIGHGGRSRDRDRGSERISVSREDRSENPEVRGAYEAAENRTRRNDRRERAEREPLTEEQIAERVESIREKLAQRLEDEKITQEEYDEKIAALESGEYPLHGRGSRGSKGDKTEKPDDSIDADNKDSNGN